MPLKMLVKLTHFPLPQTHLNRCFQTLTFNGESLLVQVTRDFHVVKYIVQYPLHWLYCQCLAQVNTLSMKAFHLASRP